MLGRPPKNGRRHGCLIIFSGKVIMDLIKLKKKLKTVDKQGELTKILVEKIQSIPRFNEELRNDLELILYICSIVENEFHQTKKKSINKKQIVIDILNRIFSLKQEEIQNTERHIEFLHENGQIKQIPYYEKIGQQIIGWCFRKFC